MRRFFPLLSILIILSIILACPVFASEVDDNIAPYASDIHESSKIYWSVDDVEYSIGIHWGIVYHDTPLYITWQNGVNLLVDYDDTNPTYIPSLWLKRGSGLADSFEGEYVELDGKSYYLFDLGDSTDYFGLDCSSLMNFRDSIDLASSDLYYLADDSFRWSNAINFAHLPPSVLIHFVSYDFFGGLSSEIVSILPVVIPLILLFLALRKGIAFLFVYLRSA